MSSIRNRFVGSLFAATLGITALAHGGVTWITQDISLYANWSGGAPIDGFTFIDNYEDTDMNPGGSHILPLTGRATAATSSALLDAPISMGVDLNTTYNYNGFWSDDTPDTSLRTFHVKGTNSYIFELDQTVSCQLVSLVQNLAPFSICGIEHGDLVMGEFVPTSFDDFKTTSKFDLGPGIYRFRGDFENTWKSDTGFLTATAVSFRFIPAPASMALLSLGLLARRRRSA